MVNIAARCDKESTRFGGSTMSSHVRQILQFYSAIACLCLCHLDEHENDFGLIAMYTQGLDNALNALQNLRRSESDATGNMKFRDSIVPFRSLLDNVRHPVLVGFFLLNTPSKIIKECRDAEQRCRFEERV